MTATEVETTETGHEAKTVALVPHAELVRTLSNALLFASKDRTRPILATVRVELSADELAFVATDSYALIRQVVETHEQAGEAAVLIDATDVKSVLSMLKAVPGSNPSWVVLTFGEEALTVRSLASEVSVRYVLGEYPNYGQLWPTDDRASDNVPGYGTGADRPSRQDQAVHAGERVRSACRVHASRLVQAVRLPGRRGHHRDGDADAGSLRRNPAPAGSAPSAAGVLTSQATQRENMVDEHEDGIDRLDRAVGRIITCEKSLAGVRQALAWCHEVLEAEGRYSAATLLGIVADELAPPRRLAIVE